MSEGLTVGEEGSLTEALDTLIGELPLGLEAGAEGGGRPITSNLFSKSLIRFSL